MSSADQFDSLIAGLRTEGGLSVEQIAERSGVSHSTLYRLVNREVREPLLSSYVKLASCYQRTLRRDPPPLDLKRR
jgi:transcriptional regulator with XRE-family HTH domain